MTGQQLRNSILQEAIQGRLVPNVLEPGEKTGAELLQQILKERQDRENKEKGKKAKELILSTIEDEPWELPEEWCWSKLGDVGEFTRGNGIKKDEVTPEGYPCVRYGELYTRYKVQFSSVVSHVNESIYNKAQKIETGDVVMALTGENEYDIALASVYLGTTPIAMGGDMTKLHPYCLDSKYLVYAINSPYGIECKSLLATGQIIVHISNDKLASIQIPIPPLSIQKAIVEKIEVLLPLIDEYDKAAVELETLNKILPDKLRKSVLQEAIHGTLVSNDLPEGEATAQELLQQILKERQEKENKEKGKKAKKLTLSTIEEEPWELPEGWCWCKLGDIISLLSGRDLEPNKYNDAHTGIPYITGASNFDNGSIIINRWTPTPISVSSKGDLLITCKGTVGALAFNTIGDIHIARQIMAISPFLINPEYLMVFLKSKVGDFNTQANGVIPGISREDILLADFPLPPLSIQHRIAEKMENVFSSINKLESNN